MSERPFDDLLGEDDGPVDDDTATSLAAGIAERLVDEIARPDHSWRTIEVGASALAGVARRALPPAAGPR